MLRLGDVVSRHGAIPPTAADQAVATVRRFRLLAEAAGAGEILAKATSAIRRASNGGEVVDRIRAETGVHVEVIGGQEEARLIFGAIRASVVLDPAPAAVLRPRRRKPRSDGGRLQQPHVGDQRAARRRPPQRRVRRLGSDLEVRPPRAARSHRRDPRAGRRRGRDVRAQARGRQQRHARVPRRDGRGAARRRRSRHAQPAHHQPRRSSSTLHKELLGFEGGRPAADRRARRPARRPHRGRLAWCSRPRWSSSTSTSSRSASGRCARASCSTRSVVTIPTDWSDDPHAIRGSAVLGLARRCNWAEPHARQVAKLSLDLFDATVAVHRLDDADRELLEFAALLHDIGEHVASTGHHKHGAYLVRNGQLRGFAPDEIELLAAIVRWHRRGEPRVSDEFPLLDAARDRTRARARRAPPRGRRPRPQPQPERLRGRRDGDAVARAAANPRDRRRRARDLGRPPQARAAREGARPRARAHHAPVDGLTPLFPKGCRPCGPCPSATIGSTLPPPARRSSCRSPYDGHEIDRVPACGAPEVERAVANAVARAPRRRTARMATGRDPRSRRGSRSAERTEEFARIVAEEAAKPIKTARVEATARGVDVHVRRGRSAASHRRDGAARRRRRRRGQARVHPARPHRRGRRDQPVQLPAQPRRAQVGARHRRRVPGGAEAGVADTAVGDRARRAAPRRVRAPVGPPQRGHRRRRHRRQRHRRRSRHRAHHVHRLTRGRLGHQGAAPRKKVGLELGNNAPVIIEPDGDVTTAAAKIAVAGFSHAGQSCISTQRVYLHEAIADAFLDELVPRVEALVVGDPLDETTDVSALISSGERDRVESWIDEAVAAGAKRRRRWHRAQRRARADRAHRTCSPT